MTPSRWLATLAFIFMLFVGSIASPTSPPPEKISASTTSSVVRLQRLGNDTFCSGFVINQSKRWVMTADHCMNGEPAILVNRSIVREIFHIPDQDVAVLELSPGDPLPPDLKADLNPLALDQKIASFGYAEGKGMKRIDLFVVFPRMMFPESAGTFVLMSPNLIGGMSGGPIMSLKGVVGINMAGRNDPDLAVMRPIGPIFAETKAYWFLTPEGGENVEVHP